MFTRMSRPLNIYSFLITELLHCQLKTKLKIGFIQQVFVIQPMLLSAADVKIGTTFLIEIRLSCQITYT